MCGNTVTDNWTPANGLVAQTKKITNLGRTRAEQPTQPSLPDG